MTEAFLDVRRHGFARVAVCVPAVRVADPAFNGEAHLRELRGAHERGAHYAVCPELGLSSYTCGDLFFQDRLLDGSLAALAELAEATRGWNLVFSVGLPLRVGGALYNCAVTVANGRALAVAPKAYPPNYREFYELRWFQPARHASVESVEILGREVPFGTDILITLPEHPGFVLHTEICEDIWVPVPPSALAALAGATVLANLSASNVTIGKFEYRRDLVRMSSAKNLAVQLYTAAGFGESTADLAWDGHGLIADRGEILIETERFTTGGSHVVADVDLAAITGDRARQTSFAANAADCAGEMRQLDVRPQAERRPVAVWTTLLRPLTPTPFVPSDPAELDRRCRELFLIQANSLARRLIALPEGRRGVVLGVSGGRDSTQALLVAIHAMDLLGLPRASVTGITMPGFGTSDTTYRIACRLVRSLGATLREMDIRRVANEAFAALGHDPQVENLTFENVQAWTRKLLLFATAGQVGAIDLGTSDLSELGLGFTTYGGDHMSHYGVNAGIPKTLISALIGWAREAVFANERDVADALRDVLALPISPELLRPGADGTIVQHSEEVVGPYELHDFFLYHFVRFGLGPQRLARMALAAFSPRYDLPVVKRWLLVFLERFFASQYKRDCVPNSPKVGSGGSLSPRGDWRMPADASADAWLEAARAIPDV